MASNIIAAIFTYFIRTADLPISSGMTWGLVGFAVAYALLFGFVIAAFCRYMAGLVGSSNSPISGIGIIANTFVSLLLLVILGSHLFADPRANKLAIAIAIFITSVVLAVETNSNDNLQDLKRMAVWSARHRGASRSRWSSAAFAAPW